MIDNQTMTSAPKLDLRWTFSNALSALRGLLAIPAALTIMAGMGGVTIAIFVFATITDLLDGYLARRLNEVSDLGKILDPLADKIFIGAVVVAMLLEGMLPLWFVAVILARDLLILAGGVIVERRTRTVLPSNYPGKIAVLILSTTLLLIVAGVGQTVIQIMMGIALALLSLSFVLYLARAAKVWREAR